MYRVVSLSVKKSLSLKILGSNLYLRIQCRKLNMINLQHSKFNIYITVLMPKLHIKLPCKGPLLPVGILPCNLQPSLFTCSPRLALCATSMNMNSGRYYLPFSVTRS